MGALVVGLVLRLVFGLAYWVDKPLTLDEREYLLLAGNVAAGNGFQYLLPDGSTAPGEHFGRAPVYPLLLAGIIRAAGADGHAGQSGAPEPSRDRPLLQAIRIIQAAIGTVVVWLVAWLAFRVSGQTAAGVAACLAAIYPPLVWMPAYVLSETLFSAMALGCVVALLPRSARDRDGRAASPGAISMARLAAGGALAGIAVLTRPAMLFFVVLAVPWLWWRRGLVAAAVLVAAAALMIAPWTIRNAREYGRFVLVASEGGVTFWTGNHPLAIGDGDLAANLELKRANVAFREAHPGLTPEQLEPLYYGDALRWMASAPGAVAALVARKAFYTVVPIGPSYRLHSARYFWMSIAAYGAVLPFACLGFAGLARRKRVPEALLVLVLSSVVTGLIFFPQERFRIPVADPALIVCAACWAAARMASRPLEGTEVRQ